MLQFKSFLKFEAFRFCYKKMSIEHLAFRIVHWAFHMEWCWECWVLSVEHWNWPLSIEYGNWTLAFDHWTLGNAHLHQHSTNEVPNICLTDKVRILVWFICYCTGWWRHIFTYYRFTFFKILYVSWKLPWLLLYFCGQNVPRASNIIYIFFVCTLSFVIFVIQIGNIISDMTLLSTNRSVTIDWMEVFRCRRSTNFEHHESFLG